jgi:hypothetical protein
LCITPSAGLVVPHAASLQSLSFATSWTYHTFVRSYACLVIVMPICCYAHVTSDDRSHSSCVVDRPTTSTCPPPTMDFPCEVRSPFLSSFIRRRLLISVLLRSCIWSARSRVPPRQLIHILTCSLIPSHSRSCSAVCPPLRAIPLAPHNRNPSNSYQCDVPHR